MFCREAYIYPNRSRGAAECEINKMTIAAQIKAFHTTFTESGDKLDVAALLTECKEKAADTDQDWEAESTTFEFADGSIIVVCNSEVSVYGCRS